MSTRSERDPDRLPDSSDPGGPCPRCGRVSSFDLIGTVPVTFDGGQVALRSAGDGRTWSEQATVLQCSGCHDRIVVIEEELVNGLRRNERNGRGGRISWEGIYWWPTPGAVNLGPAVPDTVADAYTEGLRCLSVAAPNGAVAMFRAAMTWMVEDRGSDTAKAKNNLKDEVKQMVADGGLTATIGDWVDHVRLYGNAGVHPDLFGAVSIEEARDVASLTQTLIELLYTTPAKIAKRQAERRN